MKKIQFMLSLYRRNLSCVYFVHFEYSVFNIFINEIHSFVEVYILK